VLVRASQKQYHLITGSEVWCPCSCYHPANPTVSKQWSSRQHSPTGEHCSWRHTLPCAQVYSSFSRYNTVMIQCNCKLFYRCWKKLMITRLMYCRESQTEKLGKITKNKKNGMLRRNSQCNTSWRQSWGTPGQPIAPYFLPVCAQAYASSQD